MKKMERDITKIVERFKNVTASPDEISDICAGLGIEPGFVLAFRRMIEDGIVPDPPFMPQTAREYALLAYISAKEVESE